MPSVCVAPDEMSESRQTHVTLHDIDPQALEQLVQYAYTAEIVVGEGNVQVGASPHTSLLHRAVPYNTYPLGMLVLHNSFCDGTCISSGQGIHPLPLPTDAAPQSTVQWAGLSISHSPGPIWCPQLPFSLVLLETKNALSLLCLCA